MNDDDEAAAALHLRGGTRPRRVTGRRSDWTQAMGERFVETLADRCNVTLAAASIGRSIANVYKWRARDATFRANWDRALAVGYSRLELMLLERALHGHIVLLEEAKLTRIAMDPAMLGAEIVAQAFGAGDDPADPPRFMMQANGESLRPPSPCHLGVAIENAAYVLSWVARHRSSMGVLSDGGDQQAQPTFTVTVRRGQAALVRSVGTSSVALDILEVHALGEGPIEFEVIENSALASRPALLTLTV